MTNFETISTGVSLIRKYYCKGVDCIHLEFSATVNYDRFDFCEYAFRYQENLKLAAVAAKIAGELLRNFRTFIIDHDGPI